MTAIENEKLKYLYRGTKVPEETIMKWIREGKINTTTNNIRKVDRAVYKNARNRWQDRDEGGRQKVRIYKK